MLKCQGAIKINAQPFSLTFPVAPRRAGVHEKRSSEREPELCSIKRVRPTCAEQLPKVTEGSEEDVWSWTTPKNTQAAAIKIAPGQERAGGPMPCLTLHQINI